MRTATIYNFLLEANLMAGIAILLMIPIRRFLRKPLGSRALCFGWLLAAERSLNGNAAALGQVEFTAEGWVNGMCFAEFTVCRQSADGTVSYDPVVLQCAPTYRLTYYQPGRTGTDE